MVYKTLAVAFAIIGTQALKVVEQEVVQAQDGTDAQDGSQAQDGADAQDGSQAQDGADAQDGSV